MCFASHRTVHDDLYRLDFIEQIFLSVHEFRLVHSVSFERAMFSLTGYPLDRHRLSCPTRSGSPQVVQLIPLVVNAEALLDELEDFFLVIKLALLALKDAHATEVCFIIRDFISKELYLLEFTL